MHFSFIPPTGKIRPWSVISPVIAKLLFTLLFVNRLTKAVVIVAPALGPSLGTAAAGKWTWRSTCLKISLFSIDYGLWSSFSIDIEPDCIWLRVIPIIVEWPLIQEREVFTDSFITFPSLPVSCKFPTPGYFIVSIIRARPPTVV